MTDFKDKVVLITGASSGIGLACAKAFSARGAKLVLSARDRERLDRAATEIGGDVLTVVGDVSKEDDCRRMVSGAVERFGRLDILINNAGISMRSLFKDTDLDVIRQLMDINFWGTVYCTKFALPHVLEAKGAMVMVSSIAGYRGLPARTGYSASKHAMQGFWETLRTEHLKDDIHLMLVCPGFTASNIRKTALDGQGVKQGESPREEKKMMSAETVADHILKGLKSKRRQVILTTQGKLAVWMNKLFPGWMDKMVYNHLAKEKDSPLK